MGASFTTWQGRTGPQRTPPGARWKGLLVVTLALALLVAPPEQAPAQDLASLVADGVSISGKDTLVADGNVEVFFQGRTLQASRIVYDKAADRLTIDGPIVLKDGAGTVILADQAELSADMQDGVLQSARVVLNKQLQLASSEIMRIGGRYTALGRSVVSSCQVCAGNPTPLWEIRARRVIHDEQTRQIYFDRAQLRFFGVPVAFIPRLRIPDPTVSRARGVLRPSIRSSSALGFGLQVPYFIPIGESRDLTLTPFAATKNAQSLGFRYRQAFDTGRVTFNGAISRDDILGDQPRFYGKLDGVFALPRGFALTFSGTLVSDRAYLRDYALSDADRLDSRIDIVRTRRDDYINGRLVNYRSIRAGESNSTLPTLVGDATWTHRFSPAQLGGTGSVTLQSHAHTRSSDLDTDSNGDGIADGRDMARLSLGADWRRTYVLPAGVLLAALTEVDVDAYSIGQDAVFGGTTTRASVGAGLEFRWPWTRAGANGASHVIEPIAQLLWSTNSVGGVPNEDSRLVEFDEGNLFSFTRFAGRDAVERGPRANLGLSYTRYDPTGWTLGVTMGRVIRTQDYGQFGVASGLQGVSSDWLAATQLVLASGLTVTNRLVFDDDFGVTKADMRLTLSRARYGFNTNYVTVMADPTENRTVRASELSVGGSYRINDFLSSNASSRYDFQAQRVQSTGLGLGFKNECIQVDLSLARSFASTTAVRATTDFAFSVDLLGFGGKALPGPARTCRG